jgi:hypothetical protein
MIYTGNAVARLPGWFCFKMFDEVAKILPGCLCKPGRQCADPGQRQHGNFFMNGVGVLSRINYPEMLQVKIGQGTVH